ncbi:hydrophobin [Melanogaster broomeanus]|nr:hydrophobin [Melanogaster broomeanus]
MFARLFAVASLAALAVASPHSSLPVTATLVLSAAATPSRVSLNELFAVAGLASVLAGVTGPVGLNCVPVISADSCQQQPVCCTGNNYNGLVNVGCSPINVNA